MTSPTTVETAATRKTVSIRAGIYLDRCVEGTALAEMCNIQGTCDCRVVAVHSHNSLRHTSGGNNRLSFDAQNNFS